MSTFEEAAKEAITHLHQEKNVLAIVPRGEHMNLRKQFNLFILETVYGVKCPTENDLQEMSILIKSYLKSQGIIRFVENTHSDNPEYAEYKQVMFA